MEELTKTQQFMIEQINKEIEKTKKSIVDANEKDKNKYRMRIAELNRQLENAKKPINRSEKDKELINKMIQHIQNNTEIEDPIVIEGDRSDKPMTSRDEFRYKLLRFVNENKNKIVELNKAIAVQQEVYNVLSRYEPVSEENMYRQNVTEIYNNIVKLKVAMKSMQERVDIGDKIIKEIDDNYELISRINRFLGNVIVLKDYEEYAEQLKKEVEEEIK